MAWSWSHTQEAYRDAERNLIELDDSTAAMIFAEWKAKDSRDEYAGGFNTIKYIKGMMKAVNLIRRGFREGVDRFIWEAASEKATCDNGGFNAWLCPYGCGSHTVPFDREHVE
jgi:hypothetical protein